MFITYGKNCPLFIQENLNVLGMAAEPKKQAKGKKRSHNNIALDTAGME